MIANEKLMHCFNVKFNHENTEFSRLILYHRAYYDKNHYLIYIEKLYDIINKFRLLN